jgi:dTDP-glucose pyrophosphorylase
MEENSCSSCQESVGSHLQLAQELNTVDNTAAPLAAVLYVQVDDPSKYGVVVIDEYGQVQRFVEKPKVR